MDNSNILDTFPLYAPFSAGSTDAKGVLTIQTINQMFPFLSTLCGTIYVNVIQAANIDTFVSTTAQQKSARALSELFSERGSDKSSMHNYEQVYGVILEDKNNIKNIFEVGLGTNNGDVISNMGGGGRPGASLRAFRDYCPNANVYGADIDSRILFEEDRIKTFCVDQTNPSTFSSLPIPNDIDLIIDDGLHSPNANVQVLNYGLPKIRIGGWVVIEDINPAAQPIWEVVAALLPQDKYKPYLLISKSTSRVFAVNRTA
jgi:hypothetical protein